MEVNLPRLIYHITKTNQFNCLPPKYARASYTHSRPLFHPLSFVTNSHTWALCGILYIKIHDECTRCVRLLCESIAQRNRKSGKKPSPYYLSRFLLKTTILKSIKFHFNGGSLSQTIAANVEIGSDDQNVDSSCASTFAIVLSARQDEEIPTQHTTVWLHIALQPTYHRTRQQ